jgi:cold shock CspA family protein/ribosome-associated translation inhibitor RaiA
MKVPLEISYRNVEKTQAVEDLIRDKVDKLRETCRDMVSCRIAVERPQQHQRSGSPFRVRIDVSVPGRELVVKHEPGEGELHDDLPKILRGAFEVALRRLREFAERRRGEIKAHPQQQAMALVARLFREEGYGFVKTPEGREIYFHRNSVLHGDFDRLEIGTGVSFTEEAGEKGPQASTVQIVDKPGARIPGSGESGGEPR